MTIYMDTLSESGQFDAGLDASISKRGQAFGSGSAMAGGSINQITVPIKTTSSLQGNIKHYDSSADNHTTLASFNYTTSTDANQVFSISMTTVDAGDYIYIERTGGSGMTKACDSDVYDSTNSYRVYSDGTWTSSSTTDAVMKLENTSGGGSGGGGGGGSSEGDAPTGDGIPQTERLQILSTVIPR